MRMIENVCKSLLFGTFSILGGIRRVFESFFSCTSCAQTVHRLRQVLYQTISVRGDGIWCGSVLWIGRYRRFRKKII